ncbi:hypothetical protein ENSA5_25210 [Enhygromyxa salina]|uniref:Endo-1,4-beta-xylanase A n=1 Tax=Enhygromyxa salina TaxID=215803 RepID=A0A2S9YB04_9BACT|nr:hypothetical protein [Enhygromyxa salina]PRQ02186.1 hypothetical protein ENSA5_25210 [Enhygromyxa salina]
MSKRSLLPLTCCALLLAACGGSGNQDSSSADGANSAAEGITTNSTNETGDGTNDNGTGDGDGDSGDTDPGGDGDGDGDPGDGDTDTNDDGGVKFDIEATPDASMGGCGDMGMEPEFSYIWVANSGEGTISKVNTQTLEEEGRYRTRSDAGGSPSRTSVNLSGDVAVANRTGGVTKVIALPENCDEMTNGQPGLQTSSGKDDVLAWGEDDCIAWYTAVDPNYTSQRPLAWTSGLLNPNTCEVEDQYVWSTASASNQPGSLNVMRLDGTDGSFETEFPIPEISPGYFGGYGGAVDSENDYWFITYDSPRKLVQVDFEDLGYEIWDVPQSVCSYGFTVDSLDRPWIGAYCDGTTMFDPETDQWTTIPGLLGYGLQEDANQTMWLGTYNPPGIRAIDINTMEVGKWIQLPTNSSRGVSVDFYGYVWFVDMQNSAWRVDTEAETWDSYAGLNSPYTYSDMTGWGLNLASGGIPQG